MSVAAMSVADVFVADMFVADVFVADVFVAAMSVAAKMIVCAKHQLWLSGCACLFRYPQSRRRLTVHDAV